MINQSRALYVIATIIILTGCANKDGKKHTGNVVVIEVSKNDCMNPDNPIVTQTTSKSCSGGTLSEDPKNVACQSTNENSSSARKIEWQATDGEPFKLVFHDGTPFKNVSGAICKPETPKNLFRCNMASKNSSGLKPLYKYDVVYETENDDCRLDPHILLN